MIAQRSVAARTVSRPAAVNRAVVKPVAALKPAQKVAMVAGASALVMATSMPAEASQLLATVAATEGYPFVPPAWMPSVLVPTVGLIIPAIAMGWAFNWIQKEAPQK